MRAFHVLSVLSIAARLTYAGDQLTMNDPDLVPIPPAGARIQLTINPEGRLNVALPDTLPSPSRCGAPLAIPLEIRNQGFVTAPLEAMLVGVPVDVRLELKPEPLRGTPAEMRTVRITLLKPTTVDVTVAFHANNQAPDPSGHDRIHFVLHCLQGWQASRSTMSTESD